MASYVPEHFYKPISVHSLVHKKWITHSGCELWLRNFATLIKSTVAIDNPIEL